MELWAFYGLIAGSVEYDVTYLLCYPQQFDIWCHERRAQILGGAKHSIDCCSI